MARLIRRHRGLLGEKVRGGQKGYATKISKEGLFELRNIVGVKSRKDIMSLPAKQAKQDLAQKVVELSKPPAQFSNAYLILQMAQQAVEILSRP